MQTTIFPTNAIPNFSTWNAYIKTMNFELTETEIQLKFYFREYPGTGVIDMNPFFLIQGSFSSHIVDHIQRRTGKHFPDIGQNIFEAITIHGNTFAIVNRHLLMDAIMNKRVNDLDEYLKNDIFKMIRDIFFVQRMDKKIKLDLDQQFQIISIMAESIIPKITKTLDI